MKNPKNQDKHTAKRTSKKRKVIAISLTLIIAIGLYGIYLSVTNGPLEYRLAEQRCKKPPIVGVGPGLEPMNSDDRTYSRPNDLYYDMDTDKNNFSLIKLQIGGLPKYFCTEREAIDAGYRNEESPLWQKADKKRYERAEINNPKNQ